MRSSGERGFLMVEVMVAAMLAVLVIGATATLFVTGNKSSLGSQRNSQLIAAADQEIENIRQAVKTNGNGFAALALTAAPAAGTSATLSYSSTTHTDPNDFLCGAGNAYYQIENNYNNTAEGTVANVPTAGGCTGASEPLQIGTGNAAIPAIVNPGPTTVTVGTETASVYRYVTDTNVGCATLSTSNCTGDARRVIVAVKLNGTGTAISNANAPVFVSTIFANPVPSNQYNSSIGLTVGVTLG